MQSYSGNLRIYFPYQLKGRKPLKWHHKKWNLSRDRQVRDVHMRKALFTDLLDLEHNRNKIEDVICSIQDRIDVFRNSNTENAPYGLKCFKKAYRKSRENNYFSKNSSAFISRFTVKYEKLHNDIPYNIIQAYECQIL